MKKIAIFGSGSGSNAENIFLHFRNNKNIKVAVFLCNRADAGLVERGKKLGVRTIVFDKKELYESDRILNILLDEKIDLIVLAGFLLLLPEKLLRKFPGKIINIHPALLPKYGGKGMYGMKVHEAVIAHHEKESGISIHFVNENFDEGKIIFQAKCNIGLNETPQSLSNKVLELEHEHYPEEIEKLLSLSQNQE